MNEAIMLFDGECNLCSGAVGFILARDTKHRFLFASQQSPAGQKLLGEYGLLGENAASVLETVVVIENQKAYTCSGAALRIARHLNKAWPLLYGFILIPAPLRDAVYRLVARNRYKWFGKRETCLLPTPERRSRFLA